MTFYILLLLFVLFIILRNYKYKTASKIFIFITSIVLIILSGLRHEGVGQDTYAYIFFYEDIQYTSWDDIWNNFFQRAFMPKDYEDRDPGLSLIMKCLYTIGLSTREWLFFVASFLIVPLGIVVYKFSENLKVVLYSYVFYVALFYGYLPNSAVRQSVALSFVLWAFLLLRNRRFVLATISITLGAVIHRSAFIALPIIPFLFTKRTRLLYVLSIVLFFVIIVLQDRFVTLLLGDDNIYGEYNSYYSENQQGKPINIILLMIGHYLLSMFYVWKYRNFSLQIRIVVLSSAACFALTPLIWVNPTALRTISYYGVFVPMLFAMMCSNVRYGRFLLLMFILVFLYYTYSQGSNYHFMWEQIDLPDSYVFNRR